MNRNTKEWFRMAGLMLIGGAVTIQASCSLDDLLGSDKLPPHLTDPAITHTQSGARAVFNGALASFKGTFAGVTVANAIGADGGSTASVVGVTGLLSDELHHSTMLNAEDAHQMPQNVQLQNSGATGAYSRLQRTRTQSGQAIELLKRYDPENAVAIAHAYAIQGYTEVFLAEIFCSGIPLSTLDFEGDFTYKPGSSTQEVLERAIAHFDSALALTGDSVRIEYFARLGKARALLGLGRFDEAAATVTAVPDDYKYTVSFPGGTTNAGQSIAFLQPSNMRWDFIVADRKGGNGLDYISSGDPRTAVTSVSTNTTRGGMPVYHPNKYQQNGGGAFIVASGIEARLIEAEAALRARDPRWLELLNYLRQTAYTTIVPPVTEPLPDLEDPGTDETRVDLLFRERAFWLFLTGQRQGDMRRLVRHYNRTPDRVYPIGLMPGPGGLSYGGDIDAPIPPAEFVSNPHFNGCLARGN